MDRDCEDGLKQMGIVMDVSVDVNTQRVEFMVRGVWFKREI